MEVVAPFYSRPRERQGHAGEQNLDIASLIRTMGYAWQEWRDSNPQPPVLETGALAIELHSSGNACGGPKVRRLS